jgi:ribonuclease R
MPTREQVLTHLQSHHYRPIKLRRLARFFDISDEDYAQFKSLVKQMIRDGDIGFGPQGKLMLPLPAEKPGQAGAAPPSRDRKLAVTPGEAAPPAAAEGPGESEFPRAYARASTGAKGARGSAPAHPPTTRAKPSRFVEGRFSLSQRGFGFVMPADPTGVTHGEDIFIPPDATLGAITGDTVVAEVAGHTPKGYAGAVVEIVKRGQTRFVGTYLMSDTGPIVRPDGTQLFQDVPVPDAASSGAKPKDKVVFEVLKFAVRGEPGEAVIVEVLGPRGAPGVDTLTVIRQFALPDEFSEEVEAEARSAADRMTEAVLEGRRDFTNDTVVTIDPIDARDFDDAISLTENADGTFWLGIHIADVSYFVPPGSAIDQEAELRGTSVYLPQTVIPMLPEVLSNGVCSLQEGRTRLTKSAVIRFSAEGEPQQVELANSYIRSAKRLHYVQASEALEGKTGGLPEAVVTLLKRMERLAKKLLARRQAQGYLQLDLPEVDLEFNDEGRVIAAHPQETSFSHRIIEMFMVEANEAVARELDRGGITIIRRIHPEPDNEATEDLDHYSKSVGYSLGNARDRFELQRLLNAVRGKPEAYGVHLAVLRSLKRAEYSTKREGHFALGSEAYCHFTSPIRRYPDLTVHRAFDELVKRGPQRKRGGRHKGEAEAEGAEDPATVKLQALAVHCSLTERRAAAAEDELTKIKLLEYLQTRLGDTFVGIITGVQQYGLFVESPELLVDGLVHTTSLRDDTYRFDKRRWALVGTRTGRVLRVGTQIEVRIAGVNIPRRELDLEPVVKPRAAGAGQPTAKQEKAAERKATKAARQAAKAEKWAKRQKAHKQNPAPKRRRKR